MKKLLSTLLAIYLAFTAVAGATAPANPTVRLTTNMGVIELELFRDKAPNSVDNFLRYVKSGHYNGTIFHRVIRGFMIQGGGYLYNMQEKPTRAPIQNEADNGLKNVTGTIAMARTPDPHSATSQFFINTVDNVSLDYYAKSAQGWGYAVFGKVTRGMDVVRKIESTATRSFGYFQNVPAKPIVIEKAELLPGKK
ncbi:MAG: peptidyl-prolyl cis-trans isomerase [Acidiferrobacterales bacterium]|nr:peptidyl-prolyl cis-trans isomerase [Acidiferrobacterales bacterium]